MNHLENAVQDSIKNIERSIRAYVFDGENSAYRVVAIELRKLLLDARAAASFNPSHKKKKIRRNVFELHFGKGEFIQLRSFMPDPDTQEEDNDLIDVMPFAYLNKVDILSRALHYGNMVTLPSWLEEPFTRSYTGSVLKVGTALKYIADKEGSHIIKPNATNFRAFPRVGVLPYSQADKATESDMIDHWEQFVIDAGMRLLDARRKTDGRSLIAHGIHVPKTHFHMLRIVKTKESFQ